MTEILVHHRGKFNYFNTLSGKFRYQEALDVEALQIDAAGVVDIQELRRKIERAKKLNPADVIYLNRASMADGNLSVQDCLEFFLS